MSKFSLFGDSDSIGGSWVPLAGGGYTSGVSTLESSQSSASGGASSFWDNIFDEEIEGAEDDPSSADYVRVGDTRDGVLFLIDGREAMFQLTQSGEVPFKLAIRCAASTLSDKIISAENDLVSVCVFGVQNMKNSNQFDGVYVLQELEVPDAHQIIALEDMTKTDDYSSTIGAPTNTCNLSDALWTASSLFSSISKRFGTKRVFLFTNDDNPNGDDPPLQVKSQQRAQDLFDLGIQIELFAVESGLGAEFDVKKFYQEIISYSDVDSLEEEGVSHFHSASDFEALHKQLNQKIFKKRALGRIPLCLSSDIQIGVRLYNLRQEAKPGSYVWLDEASNHVVKSTTKNICEKTKALLMPTQTKSACEYGDVAVEFDKEELTTIKTESSSVGIRVIGFKPRKKLKDWHNSRHSSFIFPDETTIVGSTVAFLALLEKMIELEQVAIAKFTPRSNSAPKVVALLPQLEVIDEETGDVMMPNGMHVIFLPFADDCRNLKFESGVEPTEEQVKKAKKMVRALTIRFDSREFPNPHIQRHYDMLQTLALDRDKLENVKDLIGPDVEGLLSAQDKIHAFRDVTLGTSYSIEPVRKRKRGGGEEETGDEPPKKGPKRTVSDGPIDWWSLDEAQIGRFTVPVLKSFLIENGQKFKSGIKKAELVHEVTFFIATNTRPE